MLTSKHFYFLALVFLSYILISECRPVSSPTVPAISPSRNAVEGEKGTEDKQLDGQEMDKLQKRAEPAGEYWQGWPYQRLNLKPGMPIDMNKLASLMDSVWGKGNYQIAVGKAQTYSLWFTADDCWE